MTFRSSSPNPVGRARRLSHRIRPCFPPLALALALAAVVALPPKSTAAGDYPALYRQLTEGIEQIELNGARPGTVNLLGRETFPLLQDRAGNVWAAAGQAGEGRIFVAAHTLFLEGQHSPAAHRMLGHVLAWMNDGDTGRVALIGGGGARGVLQGLDWEVVGSDQEAEVIIINGAPALDEYRRRELAEHVRQGGGLMVIGTPWAYEDDARDGINDLISGLGLRWGEGLIQVRREVVRVPAEAPDPVANPHVAMARLTELLEDDDADHASVDWSALGNAVAQLPANELGGLVERLGDQVGDIIPSPENTLQSGTHDRERAMVRLQQSLMDQLPVDQVSAHPAAAVFPGSVPDDAERVSATVTIDGDAPPWDPGRTPSNPRAPYIRGTGLYAAPGETIRVTVPEQAAGQGLRVRVGMYGRDITRLDRWQRWPSQLGTFGLEEPSIELATPFGGLINIEVPQGSELGGFEVTIEGAVAAPEFVLGRDDPEQWSQLREAPAPWGQVESRRLILTVPSEVLREVDNLIEVLEFWDTVMDANADLAAIPRDRPRKEWICTDAQLVAGYMHSGYPVGVNTAQAADLFDMDRMRQRGDWGFFHELGHNHQHVDWLLPGTIESSVNLWSVYIMEEILDIPRNEAHPALRDGQAGRRWSSYVEAGKPLSEWQVWLALDYYLQIEREFGWQAFKDVFAAYQQLAEEERPRNDREKFDLWLVKLSRAVGRDLTDFHAAWNLPMSDAAKAAVADLEPWLDHPATDPS